MKRFLTAVVLSSCFALSVWSQTLPPPQQALFQLRQFLGLTDSQVSAILQNNSDYNTFSFQQQRQIQNAQAQIALETTKEQLDPMTIGTLYVGIESACRELREKASTSQKQNLSILTEVQKAKLIVLNDALKLAPAISEAQSGNLLGSPNSPAYAFSGFGSGIISGVLGGIGFPSIQGCVSFPGNIIPANRLAPNGTSLQDIAALNTAPAQGNPPVNRWFNRTDFVSHSRKFKRAREFGDTEETD